MATRHATASSDARHVGFGSPQEVIQSGAEDHAYPMPVPVHQSLQLQHFSSDGHTDPFALTSPHENSEQPDPSHGREATPSQEDHNSFPGRESFTPQEILFGRYSGEMLADIYYDPHFPTCQPDLVDQNGYGESFAPHQDQQNFVGGFTGTPYLETQMHLPERLFVIFSI